MEALSPNPELNPRTGCRRRERRRILPLWLFGNGAALDAASGWGGKGLTAVKLAKALSLLSAACLAAGGYFGGSLLRSGLSLDPFDRPRSVAFPQRDAQEQKLLDDLSQEAAAPSVNSLGMLSRANPGALTGGCGGSAPGGPRAGPADASAGAAAAARTGGTREAVEESAARSGSDPAAGSSALGGGASGEGAAPAGRLPGSGFGRLRDSVSGGRLSGGPGLSGGLGAKFPSGLGNSLLARAKDTASAPGAASGLSKNARARLKQGVLPRGAGSLSLSAPTARRLERMERAFAPTKGSPDVQGSAETHTQEWSSPQDAGSAAQTAGVPSTAIGAGPGVNSGGEGLGDGGPLDPHGINQRQTEPPKAPPVTGGKDKTPNKGLIEAAQYLLLAASGLLVVAGILGLIADAAAGGTFGASEVLTGIAAALAGLAAVLALTVAGIGVALMAQGQILQGAIFAIVGAVLTVIAAVAAKNYYDAMNSYSAAGDAAAEAAAPPGGDGGADGLGGEPIDDLATAVEPPPDGGAGLSPDAEATFGTWPEPATGMPAQPPAQPPAPPVDNVANAQASLGSITKPFDGGAVPLSGLGAVTGAMGSGAGGGE